MVTKENNFALVCAHFEFWLILEPWVLCDRGFYETVLTQAGSTVLFHKAAVFFLMACGCIFSHLTKKQTLAALGT